MGKSGPKIQYQREFQWRVLQGKIELKSEYSSAISKKYDNLFEGW